MKEAVAPSKAYRVPSVFCTFDDLPGGRLSYLLPFRADGRSRLLKTRTLATGLTPKSTAVPSATILIDREVLSLAIFPPRNRIVSYLYLRSSNNHHHFRVASTVHVPVGIHTANHPALYNKLKYSPPHILNKQKFPKIPTKIDEAMNVNRFYRSSECRTCRYPKSPSSAFSNLPRRSSGLGKREKDPKSGNLGRQAAYLFVAHFLCVF